MQTGSECAAVSSHCQPVARKWLWHHRQYSGLHLHRGCHSRHSPWPPGLRSGLVCSPGRWDSSNRSSAPITEADTHLNRHTHKKQVRPDGRYYVPRHWSHLEEIGPAAVHSNYTVCECQSGPSTISNLTWHQKWLCFSWLETTGSLWAESSSVVLPGSPLLQEYTLPLHLLIETHTANQQTFSM